MADPLELHPSLAKIVTAAGLNGTSLTVNLKIRDGQPDCAVREEIALWDGTKEASWRVESVRALFRGEKPAPSFSGEPPPAYLPLFFFIEKHAVAFCNGVGTRTDAEFEEAYSNLRRRPDSKSRDALHFYLWQAACLLAGKWVLSAAEFEAIFGRLTLSASAFRMGPVSRNYLATIRAGVT